MRSLKIEHQQQEDANGCLAACAQMALAHLGVVVTQAKLNRFLGLTPAGVPASHLKRLEHYSVKIEFQKGTAKDLKQAIAQGIPPIVFVHTSQLPYWKIDTQHALLVSGYDDETFLLNDPVFPELRRVSILELMLAWDEFDNRYALITSARAKA
jgi:ABC-type bacteriocin/lantibiotic exporter with double-glycine peptidase domain